MALFWEFLTGPVAQRWSSVLLHFTWQGFAVAAFVSLILRLRHNSKAEYTYAVLLAGLLLMVVLPLATFVYLNWHAAGEAVTSTVAIPTALPAAGSLTLRSAVAPHIETAPREALELWANNWVLLRAVFFACWCTGQVVLGGRLALAMLFIWRIRRTSRAITDELGSLVGSVAKRIGLRRVPIVRATDRIHDAAVVGIVWRTVLIPAAWLTQMSPQMLQAVIAHEFAHIRRHDALVNLLQRVVETVFFFHPAVWWLSKQIRRQRERCCDQLALSVTGDRQLYAQTLEQAARQRAGLPLVLVSNLGGDRMSLLDRVKCVLDENYRTTTKPAVGIWWHLGVWFFVLIVALSFNLAKTANCAVEPATPAKKSPHELNTTRLPDYRIDPPDVLSIRAIRLVPKTSWTLGAGDLLEIAKTGLPSAPIAGPYRVEENGTIDFGKPYGSVLIAGQTVAHAAKKIENEIARVAADASVHVELKQVRHPIFGEYLVGPDGTVGLGRFGRVQVSGKKIQDAERAIEHQLDAFFESAKVSIDIAAYNSKVFYVIQESAGSQGDRVLRMPITGNETVLDALAQIGGVDADHANGDVEIKVSRPVRSADGKSFQTTEMKVDWEAITRGSSVATNYQLFPGDRVIVSKAVDIPKPAHEIDRLNRMIDGGDFAAAAEFARQLVAEQPGTPLSQLLADYAKVLDQKRTTQVETGHRQLAELIEGLQDSAAADARARKSLKTKLVAKYQAAPLNSVVKKISKQIGADIVLDPRGLAAEGVPTNQHVSLELYQTVAADSLLNLILSPLNLNYRIQDGIIRVESARAQETADVRVYFVGDLLGIPTDGSLGISELDLEGIAELVRTTVMPDSWEELGGMGSIQPFPVNESLVVTQTREAHDSVADLLSQLRRLVEQYHIEEPKVEPPPQVDVDSGLR